MADVVVPDLDRGTEIVVDEIYVVVELSLEVEMVGSQLAGPDLDLGVRKGRVREGVPLCC